MILIDTSVWVDHFKHDEPALVTLLAGSCVLAHPYVTGELVLGGLKNPVQTMRKLKSLPQAPVAQSDEVPRLIVTHSLIGCGIGYVDAHLLVAAGSLPGTQLWTRDQRLRSASKRLGLQAPLH